MSCPYISVLTVASGRREILLRKAAALTAQTLAPELFEWVVYLGVGDAGARQALEALGLPFALRVVESDRPLGAAAARNACAQRTCGSVLLFSDDACLPAPRDLAAHVAEQERGLCVAVGSVVPEGGGGAAPRKQPKVDFGDLDGANCSVPATVFHALGGYDEALLGDGAAAVELGYRLTRQRLPFRPLPGAVARRIGAAARTDAGTDTDTDTDAECGRVAGRDAAHTIRRHPELRWRLGLHPLQIGLKRTLFTLGMADWLERLGRSSAVYQRAYLEGALRPQSSTLEEPA